MNKHSYVSISNTTSDQPILIVDRDGQLGVPLAQKISREFLTVLVTARQLPQMQNIIHVPYKYKVPIIPDNTFSKIFLHYQDPKELLVMLPSYIRKAQSTRTPLFCLLHISQATQTLISEICNSYGYASVFVYGELFGERITEHNIFNNFLHQAKTRGSMSIPNNGLDKIYPVAFTDVINGIVQVVFSGSLASRTYLLFPKTPITSLAAARMIQRLHPHVQVDFAKARYTHREYVVPGTGEYVLGEKYPLSEKIKSFNMAKAKEEEQEIVVQPAREERRLPRALLFGVALVLLTIAMPFITTMSFLLFGGIFLQAAKTNFDNGNIARAGEYAKVSGNAFVVAGETYESLRQITSVIGISGMLSGIENTIILGKAIAQTAETGLTAMGKYEAVLKGTTANPQREFSEATQLIRQTLLLGQKLEAEGKIPPELQREYNSYKRAIALFSATIDIQPSAIGLDTPKTYLVLFQNNMELRPGGGFIGSYGMLRMEKGRVRSFTIHDVYDADGKLKGHIEPPFALRRYLGVKHLFLRDSNFAVDQTENAKNAANMLNLETGDEVDGVITLSMSLVPKLLKLTGPIKVAEYNEELTSENFYMITQSQVEDNFFPGSTQKKDFLSSVYRALQAKLGDTKSLPRSELMQLVVQAVYERDITVSFQDVELQRVLIAAGLVPMIPKTSPNNSTIPDVFGISEANIGANKANYYVKRTIGQQVALSEKGVLETTVTVRYANTSTNVSKFGGDYHSYLQFVLPRDASVTQVKIDGVEQRLTLAATDPEIYEARGFRAPEGIEYVESLENGYKIYGVFLITPTHSSKTIALSYSRGGVGVGDGAVGYRMRLLKQPGAQPDPFTFSFTHPASYRLLTADEGLSVMGNSLRYVGNLSEDTELSLRLAHR